MNKRKKEERKKGMEYSKKDGDILLRIARKSIEEEFNITKLDIHKEKRFLEKRRVFVTITKDKSLRGCIGFPYPIFPLELAVYKAAKEAAFSDPRFPPLKKKELNKIKIEISILTTPKETEIEKIKIGEDGLICNFMGHSGLLLPQVATEYNMGKEEFLECLCNKAGLPKDSWKQKGFKLYKFQAQIFSEG